MLSCKYMWKDNESKPIKKTVVLLFKDIGIYSNCWYRAKSSVLYKHILYSRIASAYTVNTTQN